MKNSLFCFLLGFAFLGFTQQISLKKGVIVDSLAVKDSISQSFALYLPSSFEMQKSWPVIFIYDVKGRGKQVLSMFREAAEKEQFILAASNNVHDSLTISKNVLVSKSMFETLFAMVPIKQNGVFTAGFSDGARLASLMPTFLKEVKGVISMGATLPNYAVLSRKSPFHFVGIAGNEDFSYTEMLNGQKVLKDLKFQNNFIEFDGGEVWPQNDKIAEAMRILKLGQMAKGNWPKDSLFIRRSYASHLGNVSMLTTKNEPFKAHRLLEEVTTVYANLLNVDSLKQSSKTLRKTKLYRSQNRSLNNVLFKEAFIKEDYVFYLEEDVLTYNYNNLGWWQYQMEQLSKYNTSNDVNEQKMGKRLKAYINALIADNIDIINAADVVDTEALNFLWMLNTVTSPKSYESYLKIISYNAKIEDYDTALFYLDELLKNGYTNKDELYALANTALFRLTPEFNKTVAKYLENARYDIIEE